jgi:iron complex transport system permease protein
VSRWTAGRLSLWVVSASACWALVALGCVCVSSLGVIDWPSPLMLEFRLERVLMSSLVGLALSLAGVAYQASLRNGLAEPYLLGVAGGATLGVYVWKIPALASALIGVAPWLSAMGRSGFAFVGAMMVTSAILMIGSAVGGGTTTLLLAGVALNSVVGAFILLSYHLFGTEAGSGTMQALLVGDLQTNLPAAHRWVAFAIVTAGAVWLLLMSHRLNLMTLSDDEARSAGLNVRSERRRMLIVASLMTAAAVAVSGPIGFVGLIAPHAARALVGVDHRRMMIVSAAIGASALAVADALSRFMLSVQGLNTTLPLGVVTALVGAPLFLMVLVGDARRGGLR